ncbi:MAG: cytochrome oxidase maturation protein, cbb3-type [Bdellovibrionales bacterium RIFCSPHIGHO2_01_FULL_40_29]|nr:MAG: cytochrome oxidase maturation protein, cbb3-type [Bdellovibrionales bacterium RIFCSPHIGHO2_01_FULL_40_29]OFZ32575.1 MAG: cytochrome oxidase maturation protein, cbb3-type [Bdellovibrionales bacterium RIFCSPHIGHO2_02_FULL_40_15]
MSILFLMIPISLLLAISFLAAFIWNVSSGQVDDIDTPPHRMLEDDEGA